MAHLVRVQWRQCSLSVSDGSEAKRGVGPSCQGGLGASTRECGWLRPGTVVFTWDCD